MAAGPIDADSKATNAKERRMKTRMIIPPALAVLALAGCGPSQKDYDALKAQNEQLQAQNSQLNADIRRLQGAIRYTVNSDLLFRPGSWEMNPDGQQIIARLASQLAPSQTNKLVVNGYTDNAPIGASLKRLGVTTNQQLSEKRAQAVAQFIFSRGVRPELVSAVGHGESNPVAPNTTPQGRSQNRRVEISLGG
jgi:chemotaxis protein MotB